MVTKTSCNVVVLDSSRFPIINRSASIVLSVGDYWNHQKDRRHGFAAWKKATLKSGCVMSDKEFEDMWDERIKWV